MLEDVGLPELVIHLATLAITEAVNDPRSQAALWTRIFKHHLDLGHNSQAYEALTQNPDSSSQLDCLRQLVVVLCERSQLQDLVQFSYVNLHDEVHTHTHTLSLYIWLEPIMDTLDNCIRSVFDPPLCPPLAAGGQHH